MQNINWRVYADYCYFRLVIAGGIFVINQSVPIELKNDITAEDDPIHCKRYCFEPNKEYLLSYEVEAWTEEESHMLFVSFSKTEKTFFDSSHQLLQKIYLLLTELK